MDPQSFWKMTPREWWLVQDVKTAEHDRILQASGKLTVKDKKDLYQLLKDNQND